MSKIVLPWEQNNYKSWRLYKDNALHACEVFNYKTIYFMVISSNDHLDGFNRRRYFSSDSSAREAADAILKSYGCILLEDRHMVML